MLATDTSLPTLKFCASLVTSNSPPPDIRIRAMLYVPVSTPIPTLPVIFNVCPSPTVTTLVSVLLVLAEMRPLKVWLAADKSKVLAVVFAPIVNAAVVGNALLITLRSVPFGTKTSPEKLAGAPSVNRPTPSLVKSVAAISGEFKVVSTSAVMVMPRLA